MCRHNTWAVLIWPVLCQHFELLSSVVGSSCISAPYYKPPLCTHHLPLPGPHNSSVLVVFRYHLKCRDIITRHGRLSVCVVHAALFVLPTGRQKAWWVNLLFERACRVTPLLCAHTSPNTHKQSVYPCAHAHQHSVYICGRRGLELAAGPLYTIDKCVDTAEARGSLEMLANV